MLNIQEWMKFRWVRIFGLLFLSALVGIMAARLEIFRKLAPTLCSDVPCPHFTTRVSAIESIIGQQSGGRTYLAIGDSLTEFAELPLICGRKPINAGIGWATSETFESLGSRLTALSKPDFIIVALGTNDATRKKPGFRAQMTKLIASLSGYPLVLVPIPGGPGVTSAAEYNNALTGLAPMAPTARPLKNTSDGIHLVPSAYPAWISSIKDGAERHICPQLPPV
jgi:lysophospholipase L1-like esterase